MAEGEEGAGLLAFVDHVNELKGDTVVNRFQEEFLVSGEYITIVLILLQQIKALSKSYKTTNKYPCDAARLPVCCQSPALVV